MAQKTEGKNFLQTKKGMAIIVVGTALLTIGLTALLVSIFRHKTEATNPYLRFVEVKQGTTDPLPWSLNWPREFDQYKKTTEATKTEFGGSDSSPNQKSNALPFLTRMFAGYAFAIDYRDRRGHAFMLFDQEHTKRVTERPQPGACLHCHASLIPTLVRLGGGDPASDEYKEEQITEGFKKLAAMPYAAANKEINETGSLNPIKGKPNEFEKVVGSHPVSCTDCHNAKTMKLEVSRPGFIAGIRALKAKEGVKNYNVNKDATRSEMRSYVCAQCHVEYYCGPKVTLFFPWNEGVKVDEMEKFYNDYKFPDGHRFYDWAHAETGAELLKAQHPEFELWSQGVHAKSKVACTDCHMPYNRDGAMKVSDHHIRSPLLNVHQSCQQCHASWTEKDLKERVTTIQSKNYDLLMRAGQALTDFLDTYKPLREKFNPENKLLAEKKAEEKLAKDEKFKQLPAVDQARKKEEAVKAALNALWAEHVSKTPELKQIAELQRKAQWRLDFVAAENSMGFHAPQESARILAEATDYFRQAQLETVKILPREINYPVNQAPSFKK